MHPTQPDARNEGRLGLRGFISFSFSLSPFRSVLPDFSEVPGTKEKLYESTTRLNTLRDFGVDVCYFRGETGEKEGNKQTGAPSGGLWFSSKCHQMTKRPGPIQ